MMTNCFSSWVSEAHSSRGTSRNSVSAKGKQAAGHHKVLNLRLAPTPNGGRCLNVYVPVEEQGTHLGHFGDKT